MRYDIFKIGIMLEVYLYLIFYNFNLKFGERVSCEYVIFVFLIEKKNDLYVIYSVYVVIRIYRILKITSFFIFVNR